jgi:hypothetical protein
MHTARRYARVSRRLRRAAPRSPRAANMTAGVVAAAKNGEGVAAANVTSGGVVT